MIRGRKRPVGTWWVKGLCGRCLFVLGYLWIIKNKNFKILYPSFDILQLKVFLFIQQASIE